MTSQVPRLYQVQATHTGAFIYLLWETDKGFPAMVVSSRRRENLVTPDSSLDPEELGSQGITGKDDSRDPPEVVVVPR
jgi:hypothetical protein